MFRNIVRLYSDDFEIVATVVLISRYENIADDTVMDFVIGGSASRKCLEFFREVPVLHGLSYLLMERTCVVTLLNNPNPFGDIDMNIFDQMHTHVDKQPTKPLMMISPSSETVPEDGMLVYRTVEGLSDLLVPSKPNEVVMFRDDQKELLDVLCERSSLFGVDIVVVTGLPGFTYSAEFESSVWDKPKLAYHTIINDLLEANRRVEDTAADVKQSSIYEKEKTSFVRKTGNIKVFTGFEEPPTDDEESGGDE